MFNISQNGSGGPRLHADTALTPADFDAIGVAIGEKPFAARKTALIAARVCVAPERIETRWNGKETANTANPGDYIVTSLDHAGKPLIDGDGHQNTYVIGAASFGKLYEAVDATSPLGPTYRARGTVAALYFVGDLKSWRRGAKSNARIADTCSAMSWTFMATTPIRSKTATNASIDAPPIVTARRGAGD